MLTQMVGTFSYRFSGFSMNSNVVPYHIVGVGVMVLNADGTLTGRQTSAITRLWGSGATLETGDFLLTGRYDFDTDGSGKAQVTFKSEEQELLGGFNFVIAESFNRFWLISTGATIVKPEPDMNLMADEVVSGEAVRMQVIPVGPA